LRRKREIKFGKEQKCKNPKCDNMVPIPMSFCSSTCWRVYYNSTEKIKERAQELFKETKKIRKQAEGLKTQRKLAMKSNEKLEKKMKEFNEVFK